MEQRAFEKMGTGSEQGTKDKQSDVGSEVPVPIFSFSEQATA
jgi:hypothetical protein